MHARAPPYVHVRSYYVRCVLSVLLYAMFTAGCAYLWARGPGQCFTAVALGNVVVCVRGHRVLLGTSTPGHACVYAHKSRTTSTRSTTTRACRRFCDSWRIQPSVRPRSRPSVAHPILTNLGCGCAWACHRTVLACRCIIYANSPTYASYDTKGTYGSPALPIMHDNQVFTADGKVRLNSCWITHWHGCVRARVRACARACVRERRVLIVVAHRACAGLHGNKTIELTNGRTNGRRLKLAQRWHRRKAKVTTSARLWPSCLRTTSSLRWRASCWAFS